MMKVSAYAKHLARFGGIATVGGYLAIMVATRDRVHSCPAGWGFIDLEDATPEHVQEILDTVR